jgi:hypothetical protein
MAILNNSNAISSGGYDINNSVRLRSSASASLSRTPGSAGNRKTWTLSAWVKIGALGSTSRHILTAGYSTNPWFVFGFTSNNVIEIAFTAGTSNGSLTTAVFRDPSAWYHVVLAIDTTQATAANRVKLYVNNVQQTFASTNYPAQNTDHQVNNTVSHTIGGYSGEYFDGYLAEVNFVDGQALTPSSFGETDTTTGSWKPKAYTGTYGTNGFYLKFSDIATTSGSNAGLGKDFSGNTNYWTTNNISVTAGTTYDAMIDSPTLTSATVANYCVLNPLNFDTATLSNANLTSAITGSAGGSSYFGTMALPSNSKIYAEVFVTSVGDATSLGITSNTSTTSNARNASISYAYDGNKCVLGTDSAFGATYTANDIIGIAVDTSAGTIQFFKNNTSQGTITNSAISSNTMFFTCVYFSSNTGLTANHSWNFGQRPFTYTPPTGFVRLNTYNLPDSTIKKGNTVMDATLYAGNGGTQSITNAASFKPDLVWVKSRTDGGSHSIQDSVRGVGSATKLSSNSTNAENNASADATDPIYGYLTAINSNGFTAYVGTTPSQLNKSGQNYVGWQWQAGQGSTSSNTSGTITSTVSVNATAGFSIVTYTGNSTTNTNYTIGHGLGVAPKMVIIKSRTWAAGSSAWPVWHTSSPTALVYLDDTGSASSGDYGFFMGSTAPTSSVFTVRCDTTPSTGARFRTFGAYDYVAYCWAEIAGFSKFGSYTGNGSADGPFIYLGFRPRFILYKNSSSGTAFWRIWDTARATYNADNNALYPNSSSAEDLGSGPIDELSNGFKIRTSSANDNGNGNTFIYAAFAENPFKNANAR